MFLLSFIPTWLLVFVVNTVIIVGVISIAVSIFLEFFTRYIPWVAPHKILLQLIGIILLITGVYFKGGTDMELKWRERVAEMEVKVAAAEAESKLASSKVQLKIVEQTRYVKENQIRIEQKIDETKVKIDSDCKVSPVVIDIHNNAAKKPEGKK
jgi:preprotein translocase subunit SecF